MNKTLFFFQLLFFLLKIGYSYKCSDYCLHFQYKSTLSKTTNIAYSYIMTTFFYNKATVGPCYVFFFLPKLYFHDLKFFFGKTIFSSTFVHFFLQKRKERSEKNYICLRKWFYVVKYSVFGRKTNVKKSSKKTLKSD